jgi:hypothetical protein
LGVRDTGEERLNELPWLSILSALEVAGREGTGQTTFRTDLGGFQSSALEKVVGGLVVAGVPERGRMLRAREARRDRWKLNSPFVRQLEDAPLAIIGSEWRHREMELDLVGEHQVTNDVDVKNPAACRSDGGQVRTIEAPGFEATKKSRLFSLTVSK